MTSTETDDSELVEVDPVGRVDLARVAGMRVDDLGWRDRAVCAGMATTSPRLFFPDPILDKTRSGGLWGRARTVCAGCPVTDECLGWWLASKHQSQDRGPQAGFVGGCSPAERRQVRRLLAGSGP